MHITIVVYLNEKTNTVCVDGGITMTILKVYNSRLYCFPFEDDLYIKLYENTQITMTKIMDFFFTK